VDALADLPGLTNGLAQRPAGRQVLIAPLDRS
jgi:hypothetical protein